MHPTTLGPTTPYWSTSAFPRFEPLAAAAAVDVVVVGGGVTGLTSAYLLARAGRRVILLERERCAAIDSGHTSAHLTMVTDRRLGELVDRIGRPHAQAVWDAGRAAIVTIEALSRDHASDAGFDWVDGYLHAPHSADTDEHIEAFQGEAALAVELGFDATYVASVPLVERPGVRFADQARIQPQRYLAGLATAFEALGGRIFEHSPADEFRDHPRAVVSNGHVVTCDDIVIATHNPLVGVAGTTGAALFQTKLALYTSYVVAGRVARRLVPDALWWDTADPYCYVRVEPHEDHDVVIVGGEDHKTGQVEDTEQCYRRLERHLRALAPTVEVTHRWSGQVIETPDGLPYIGQSADRQYSATGFSGNGLTFGTLGGIMMSDAILGRSNPWRELFDPARKALTNGLWDYVKENVDYPYYMVRDRFAAPEARSLREVKRGQGRIIERDGARVAVSRDASGLVTERSAICTHMGCTVAWNAAERTWDCPCHGSRFKPTGEVISGPAEAPLAEVE